MGRNSKLNEKMRERMRRHLMNKAGILFARYGYAAISPKEIVKAADVSEGIYYYYFRNKKDIAIAILKNMGSLLSDHIDPYFSHASTLEEACNAGFNALFDFADKHKNAFLMFLREQHTSELKKVNESIIKRLLTDSEKRILQGQTTKLIRENILPAVASRLIIQMGFEGLQLYFKKKAQRQIIVDALVQFTVAGLKHEMSQNQYLHLIERSRKTGNNKQ